MAKTKKKSSKKETPSQKKTFVCLVIDRSGSMTGLEKQTIEGVNSQFKVLKDDIEKLGHTEVSLIQFDDVIQVDFDGLTPDKIQEWGQASFTPRGMTAMYDGIWNSINLLKTKEATEDTGYLICVISDGVENASKEITQQNLKSEIEKLTATGKWTFSYLMANIDVTTIYNNLGASINNVASYVSNAAGTATAYNKMSRGLTSYTNARSVGVTATNAFYAGATSNNITLDIKTPDVDDIDQIVPQDKNISK